MSVVEGEVHWTGNGSGESWLIKANSPTTDLAIELLTYLRSDEVYSQYVTETQSLPSMGWAAEYIEDPNVATMGEWPSRFHQIDLELIERTQFPVCGVTISMTTGSALIILPSRYKIHNRP